MNPLWIAAIATVIYAGFTLWIIIEMRRDRKLRYRPILKAVYNEGVLPGHMIFAIKNIGTGPAIDLDLRITSDKKMQWLLEGPILPIVSYEVKRVKFKGEYRHTEMPDKFFLIMRYHDIFDKCYKSIATFKTKDIFQFTSFD